ncbi:MAG: hypothetical protein FWD86_03895 [Firmicutes bacterium]|nr:hypothetical protein [Bacillota bacterium]
MQQIKKLFKLQIDDVYNIFKGQKRKNAKKIVISATRFVLTVLALTIAIWALFIQPSILDLAFNVQLLSIIVLLTQAIALIFAIGNLIQTLFISENNSLLLTLPVSPNQILISKMMVVYLKEIVTNCIFTLPFLIAIGIYGRFHFGFFLALPIFMLVLPLLPLSLAIILSLPALKIISFLKQKPIIAVSILLVVVGVAVWLYSDALTFFMSLFNVGEAPRNSIHQINTAVLDIGNHALMWLFFNLARSMAHIGQIYYVFIYIAISAAFFVAAVFIIRPFYFKSAMSSKEDKLSTTIKQGKYKVQHPFVSLLAKEYYTVFRSPGNVFQFFIFTLLMPIIVYLYGTMLLQLTVNDFGMAMIGGAHVLIVCVLAMLSNMISASAISREGNCAHMIKTMPVLFSTQVAAKVVFNAIFTLAAVLITAGITFIYMWDRWPIIFFCTFIVINMAVGHICLSLFFDLKKPILDWNDAGDIAKVSKSTAYSILSALGLAFFIGLFIMMTTAIGLWSYVILSFMSIGFAALMALLLFKKMTKAFEKIEMK